jgi:hypothetical protein
MNYKKYPDSKDTPSRKTRKTERNRVFEYNKTIAAKVRREKRLARRQAEEEAAEAEETEE